MRGGVGIVLVYDLRKRVHEIDMEMYIVIVYNFAEYNTCIKVVIIIDRNIWGILYDWDLLPLCVTL